MSTPSLPETLMKIERQPVNLSQSNSIFIRVSTAPGSDLSSGKLWLPLFQKRPQALACVFRREAAHLGFCLVTQHLFEFRSLAHVDCLLCRSQRNRRRLAQTFRKPPSRCLQLLRCDHVIQDPQVMGLFRAHSFAKEKHFACLVWR